MRRLRRRPLPTVGRIFNTITDAREVQVAIRLMF